MPHTTVTIDLLRHGEPEGGPMYRGSTDHPLSQLGWEQMENALKLPEGVSPPWQHIVYSPLQRCKTFALSISERLGLPAQEYHDLREIFFGDWEGRRFDEVAQNDKEAVQRFWDDPIKNMAPNGESIPELHKRVIGVWDQLQQQHSNQHLLLVAHGGVIRSLLCHVLGMPLEAIQRFSVPYAALSQVKSYHYSRGSWHQLVFHQSSYLHLPTQPVPLS